MNDSMVNAVLSLFMRNDKLSVEKICEEFNLNFEDAQTIISTLVDEGCVRVTNDEGLYEYVRSPQELAYLKSLEMIEEGKKIKHKNKKISNPAGLKIKPENRKVSDLTDLSKIPLLGLVSVFAVAIFFAWGTWVAVGLTVLILIAYGAAWLTVTTDKMAMSPKSSVTTANILFLVGFITVNAVALFWMHSKAPLWGDAYRAKKYREEAISTAKNEKIRLISIAQNSLRAQLKNPSSVDFKDEYLNTRSGVTYVCGGYRAKNSLGVYTPYGRYIAQNRTIYTSETTPDMANKWDLYCR